MFISVEYTCLNVLLFRHRFDMVMALLGYWRCSSDAQHEERQVASLKEAGCIQIWGDRITGASNYGDRPELSKCLDALREGDTWVIHELDRAGRNMVEMLVQVNQLMERGVHIKCLDGRLDTKSMPQEIVKLIVGVMGYAAEMELKNIKRRTAEGRAVAKSRGVKFGMKRRYDNFQIAEIMKKRQQGEGYGTIAKAMGMKRSTVQTIINREKVEC